MSHRLPVRLSDRTWNLIEAAATAEGITPASWVRRLVESDLGGENARIREALEEVVRWWESLPEREYQPKNHTAIYTAITKARIALKDGPQNAPVAPPSPRGNAILTRDALLNWASKQRR